MNVANGGARQARMRRSGDPSGITRHDSKNNEGQ